MQIKKFTFNPFAENTYILYDDSGECAIVDPGAYDQRERQEMVDFMNANNLKPTLLLNTHCHLDHVFSNAFIQEKYNLDLHAHEMEKMVLNSAPKAAHLYGMTMESSPDIAVFIDEGETIEFGNTTLEILLTPGHSPGSLCFLHRPTKTLVAGDVLFFDSIGRTDLPGGDHQTLLDSIQRKLLPLEDDWKVFCGHGPETTIGRERRYNPFVRELS